MGVFVGALDEVGPGEIVGSVGTSPPPDVGPEAGGSVGGGTTEGAEEGAGDVEGALENEGIEEGDLETEGAGETVGIPVGAGVVGHTTVVSLPTGTSTFG